MATNSERIAANNTRLSKLVETAESLPDAGSGGGGVETCTINFNDDTAGIGNVYFTVFEDGEIKPKVITDLNDNYARDIENVVCGSAIVVSAMYDMPSNMPAMCGGGAVLFYSVDEDTANNGAYIIRATIEAGSTGTISIG